MGFDELEAVGHVLRHLALHGGLGLGLVGPAAGAGAVGVGHMCGGGQVAVELLHACKSVPVGGGEPGPRKGLRHIRQQCGRFGQRALGRDQRGHPPLGVDGQVLWRALLACRKVHAHQLVRGSGLFQGDAHGQRTGARGVVQREHGGLLSN